MAEQEKNFLQQMIDWFSSVVESGAELAKRVGWPLAVLIVLASAGGLLWWKWKDIKERPGIEPLTKWFQRRPIPRAPADRLTIAVAQLVNDKDREHETLLVDELGHFEGVETQSTGRAVGSEAEDRKKAEEKARILLKKSGADVLIWGSVISRGDKSAMRLYWTAARDVSGAKPSGKYLPTETLALPEEFWGDLKEILGLLTQSRLADISFGQPGHFIAGKLAPLISQVRALIEKKEGVWKPEILAGVQLSLAIALGQYGEQSGQNQPLFQSAELFRKVLDQRARARVPLDWAMTQMNLGNALSRLGEREGGTARLEEAVAAYREALQENTRERVPLEWAMTQMNLGAALRALGERETGTARLKEAVAAYRAALQENIRARVPLQWAISTGNQDEALMLLAERTKNVGMAETAFRQIEAASEALRSGGDAAAASHFEALFAKARAIRDRLAASESKPSP
jgi:tetratricopeptide (TPR) repeat protein